MPTTIVTNKGKTFQNPYGQKRLATGERIELICDTNTESVLLPAHGLWRRGDNIGPTFQAGPAGTIAIRITNDREAVAMNPANDAAVAWHLWATLNGSESKTITGLVFTVVKITFTVANRIVITSL